MDSIFLEAFVWFLLMTLNCCLIPWMLKKILYISIPGTLQMGCYRRFLKLNDPIFRGNVSVLVDDEVIEKVKHQKNLGINIKHDFIWTNRLSKKLFEARNLEFFIRSTVP